ncbi:MAG TPA: hypothetical protein VHQ24_03895 [Lachnospiraceae bacterium]|nr:hypothetical protein [Lachnospiraceae bacterium]
MALVISCLAIATFFICMGLITAHSRKPAGFYSNIKAPDKERIKDLKAYNRAVGKLLCGYGVPFILVGIASLFMKESIAGLLIVLCAFPGAIVMMIVYELVISPKYIDD